MLTRRDFVRRASAGVGAAAALVDGWQARVTAADGAAKGSALEWLPTRTTGTASSKPSPSTGRWSISTMEASRPAPASSTKPTNAISTSRTRRRGPTCGKRWSPTSRPCAAGSRRPSAATARSWRSPETPARPSRSRSSDSTLKPGDEVLTTTQDYPRMLDTWDQRARREGIVVKKIAFPVPPPSQADLASRLLGAVTPADEGDPLLPHHEPDGSDLPGQ